ncbi:MAG: hypothetical protein ACRDTG_08945 [Pseudonocardiaceae bacterium]
MGAITSLERRSIAVAPGGEARCTVLVRNTGTVVDQFTVEILGEAKSWAQVDPAVVNLLPEAESTVVVLFRPPRSSDLAAGNMPFGIRVSSREDRAATLIEEGTLQIEAFTDVRLELVPRRARGRRQARIEVAVDNLGNHPTTLAIDAVDADENLQFLPEHTDLTLQAGTTAFVGVLVRPERTFLRGPERTLPFQIRATGAGVTPTVAEGAMVQLARLPKWLPAAIAALLALLIGLVALWFTVFKPTIESTAKEAAAEEVQQVADTANAAMAQADEAVRVATGGAPPGGAPGDGAPTTTPGVPPPITPAPPGGPGTREPIDFRIAADAARADNPDDFTAFEADLPADRAVLISDLVLQNPFGDSGILRLLRVVDGEETVLLEVGLNNFRDLDYHFVQPLRFDPGELIVLAVNCQNPPAPGRDRCTPSASFSGVTEGVAPETEAPEGEAAEGGG